jgi:hypothetical protein
MSLILSHAAMKPVGRMWRTSLRSAPDKLLSGSVVSVCQCVFDHCAIPIEESGFHPLRRFVHDRNHMRHPQLNLFRCAPVAAVDGNERHANNSIRDSGMLQFASLAIRVEAELL